MSRARNMADGGYNVAFPAGHVLQVLQFEDSETNALTTSYVNYWEKSVTLKSASSDVFITFTYQYYLAPGAGLGMKVYRNSSATVTTSHTAVWTKNKADTGEHPSTIWKSFSGQSLNGVSTQVMRDVVSGASAGDTLYYGFFFRKMDSAVVRTPDDETEDGFFTAIFTEVQK